MVHLSETSEFMDTYSNFQPTGFDIRGLRLADQQNWFVLPLTHTPACADVLERSNWDTAVSWFDALDDTQDEPAYEIHYFGHYLSNFEIILVNPDREDACRLACEIVSSLADYPVLDDENFSSLEWEEFEEWALGHVKWVVQSEGAIPGNLWSILSDSFCLHSLCDKLEWSPQDRTPENEDITGALVELGMVQEDK